ncbi:MAG: bifunctional chorismate mutase/prephenate dehydratase [Clostridiales bacterium]|nr:bifunctional chorismate mutase/prephenate dehydratase [Clostridiales bacterium]
MIDLKIGFQGVRGAFSDAAIRLYYGSEEHRGELPDSGYESVGYSDFIKMLQDVNEGVLDEAFFPVENTTTGIIARTYDYFQYYNVYAVGEVVEPIVQNLIVIPGTKLEEIREVYSHPEALSQCSNFFRNNPDIKTVSYEDTALAVEYVKSCGDKSRAAIASALAAELNDMEILRPHVQNSDSNMTRFLVITNKPDYPDNADKVSVYFVTRHTPSALYNVLGVFASREIDVLRLESRPIVTKRFEYCHYVDFRGNLKDPIVEEAMRQLRDECLEVIVLGNYKSAPLAL